MVSLLVGRPWLPGLRRRPNASTDVYNYERILLFLVGTGDGVELFICMLYRDPTPPFRVVCNVDELG
jgi:hypothetical protein